MDAFPDHLFTRMLFTAGEVIFDEGQRGDCAYLVDGGEVAILKRRSRGYHPLARIGPGGIFGEMALVDDQPRMAQAKALGAHAYFRKPSDFNEFMKLGEVVAGQVGG